MPLEYPKLYEGKNDSFIIDSLFQLLHKNFPLNSEFWE